jgi:FkbM family methyltransferase
MLFMSVMRSVGTGRSVRLRPRPRPVTRSVDLGPRARNVHMRRVTSDFLAYHQVFGRDQYALDVCGAGPGPSVIFDCGAHIGLTTLFFASRYPEATIVAIEPHPANFALLVKNTEHFTNVKRIEAAIWPTRARLKIKNRWAQPWGFRVAEASRGAIRGITLEDLVQEHGGGGDAVLKLDVEGAEARLIGELGSDLLSIAGVTFIEYHGMAGRQARKALEEVRCEKGRVGNTHYYVRRQERG